MRETLQPLCSLVVLRSVIKVEHVLVVIVRPHLMTSIFHSRVLRSMWCCKISEHPKATLLVGKNLLMLSSNFCVSFFDLVTLEWVQLSQCFVSIIEHINIHRTLSSIYTSGSNTKLARGQYISSLWIQVWKFGFHLGRSQFLRTVQLRSSWHPLRIIWGMGPWLTTLFLVRDL